MQRKVTLLMVFVVLLGILSGCQKEDSVFDLKFSDEQKEELLSSYQTWKAAATGLKAETETWAEYSDTEESGLTFSGYRYYGTFDGCVVWFRGGEPHSLSTAMQMYVGDTCFGHPYSAQFWVRNGEEFCTLTEAYEQGMISAEDVAIVAERHAEYNNEVSVKSSEWAKIAVESGALELPAEKQKEIKMAFLDRANSMSSYFADQMVVYAVWNSGDLYALYMDLSGGMHGDMCREVYLNKKSGDGCHVFMFPNTQLLYIYKDRTFYTLEEAWAANLLTDTHAESLLKDDTYLHPYVFYGSYYD